MIFLSKWEIEVFDHKLNLKFLLWVLSMIFSFAMKTSKLSKICLATVLAILPQCGSADDPVAGCGNEEFNSGIYTMEHGSLTRTYRVHVPRGFDPKTPTPLVALFHGWGGDENAFLGEHTVRQEADQRGYILVAPRGIGSGAPDNSYNSWSFSGSTTGIDGDSNAICDDSLTPDYSYDSCAKTRKNTCSWTQCQADDVDFAIALVEEMKSRLCVDENRVYASGGSNGGMYTWELGQNPKSAPVFRAIAPVIGLPHRGYLGGPAKEGGMPALLITGMLDNVVPPGNWDDPESTTTSNDSDRFHYTGATAITKSWASAQGCDTSKPATPVEVAYQIPDCRTYCTADTGLPRVLDCRAQMGHIYDLSWSWKLVMDFFDSH
jgi:poly(3-hydroxybutyrate) depolymerase